MAYEIDKKIIEATTKCDAHFKCLDIGDCPKNKCKPVTEINSCIVVESKTDEPCYYHLPHKTGYLCACPTRVAIYKKYNI